MRPIICDSRFSRLFWACILLGCLSACSTRTDGPEYVSWIEDPANGLRPQLSMGALQFELHYQPIDYLVLQDLRDFDAPDHAFAQARSQREGLEYYRLEVRSLETGTRVLGVGQPEAGEKLEREQYLSFMAGEDIFLQVNGKSIPTALYHYEGDFGIRPHINLIFAFERQADSENRRIVFQDRVLTGQEVGFDLPATTIQNIPEYKL